MYRIYCFAISMAVLFVSPALAHSEKEDTTPLNGAQLTETPEMIHMVFGEPIRITMVRLVNANGTEMPIERETGLEPSPEFHAEPEPLNPGSYTVEWRGLATDGHAMQGKFSFELVD